MKVGVSVVICCYNSANRLPQTLAHLAAQKVSLDVPWEVIVVDNGSTDQTSLEAQRQWQFLQSTVPLRVVSENQPGLTHARTRGVSESQYDIVLFCDDDNWLCEEYVQASYEVMHREVCIGAVGGSGTVVTEGSLPIWFEKYKKYYACYPQGETSGELTGAFSFLYGAGLVVRKELFLKIHSAGVKFQLTGRKGNVLSSGEDNEFCYLVRLAGYKLWYSDRLRFGHFMSSQRLTEEYLYRISAGIAYSSMRLIVYHYLLSGKQVIWNTWFKDMTFRIQNLIFAYLNPFRNGTEMEKKVERLISWMAFKAVAKQFALYTSMYKALVKFQSDNKEQPWIVK